MPMLDLSGGSIRIDSVDFGRGVRLFRGSSIFRTLNAEDEPAGRCKDSVPGSQCAIELHGSVINPQGIGSTY